MTENKFPVGSQIFIPVLTGGLGNSAYKAAIASFNYGFDEGSFERLGYTAYPSSVEAAEKLIKAITSEIQQHRAAVTKLKALRKNLVADYTRYVDDVNVYPEAVISTVINAVNGAEVNPVYEPLGKPFNLELAAQGESVVMIEKFDPKNHGSYFEGQYMVTKVIAWVEPELLKLLKETPSRGVLPEDHVLKVYEDTEYDDGKFWTLMLSEISSLRMANLKDLEPFRNKRKSSFCIDEKELTALLKGTAGVDSLREKLPQI